MEDNFNQDRLEEFFRKSLEHFEEEPTPDAWEKIRRSIPEKDKKRNRGAWLWLSLLMLCLVIAGSYFILSEKYENLESRVDSLEAEAKTLSQTNQQDLSSTKNPSFDNNNSIQKPITSPIKASKPGSGTKNLGNFSKQTNTANSNTKPRSKKDIGEVMPPSNTNTNEEAFPNQSNVLPARGDLQDQPNRPSEKKKSIREGEIMEDTINTAVPEDIALAETDEEEDLLEEEIEDEENKDDHAERSLLPGKEVGIAFPFELAYGYKMVAPVFLESDFENSTTQTAWDIQLIGDIPINNKWTFQMGAGYRRMDFSGTQWVSGSYTEDGATGNTDIGISRDYRFEVDNNFTQISLLGEITQTFEERIEDPKLENGDRINFSTRLNHSSEHLIFPFLISRHGNGEKWNWRVKTGLIGTVRINHETNAEVFDIENENILFDHQSTVATYLYDGPKIEWALSAGVEYKVFGHYWLFAEPAMNMAFLGSFTGSKPFLYGGQVGLIWRPKPGKK